MSPFSTRETFDRQLHGLLEQVLVLGSMVEQAIQQSVSALQRHDLVAARRIYTSDYRINEKRYAIESECVTLIATQQPMGRDVRFLAAILEIITELERIGDYAKGISKINLLITEEVEDPTIFHDLQKMSELGLSMLRRALDAFVANDVHTARAIPADDDEVDHLYNRVYRELIRRMIIDITSADHANHLMWAAHNLERMADRVINICERIVYVSTGQVKELDITDGIELTNSASVAPGSLPKVLFLCTHNSARSQMAEAFLRQHAADRFEVHSAGLEPGGINPYTVRVMEELGLSMAGHRSKALTEYLGKAHFAYLITVCDRAEQQCPVFPGMGTRLHWSFEDPSAVTGSEDAKLAIFRQVRDEIQARILAWLASL
ncbi:MAG: phosphate signaling complex protein PhoU [Anaerolineales bacterium]|nr:phosphate signaling complex protein PhoU [Anaerolineales bacterium]